MRCVGVRSCRRRDSDARRLREKWPTHTSFALRRVLAAMQPSGLRLDQWILSVQQRSSLSLQEAALGMPADRLVRPLLFLLAARSFAPLAVREAVRLWDASTEEHAPTYRAFWRGVLEYLPYLGPKVALTEAEEAAEADRRAKCAISVEEGKRFYEALCLERDAHSEDALKVPGPQSVELLTRFRFFFSSLHQSRKFYCFHCG